MDTPQRQMLLDLKREQPPTLDNFVAGRNVELLAALRHALSGEGERCIYLLGEAGSGKSHLLQAAVRQARMAGQSAICLCRAVPEVAQVVAVDDAEMLDDAAQIALFELYNRIRENGGMLLVSGTAAPAHLRLRDDLWPGVPVVFALVDEIRLAKLKLPPDVTGRTVTVMRRTHSPWSASPARAGPWPATEPLAV